MSSKIWILLAVVILGLCFMNTGQGQYVIQNKNSTSISTSDGCRLYIGGIKFTKFVPSGGQGTTTIVDVDGFNLVNDTSKPDAYCGNNNGSIVLEYGSILDRQGNPALDNFTLLFEIEYQRKYRWWQVSSLTLFATGPLIDKRPLEVNWTGALMEAVGISASEKFGYACSKPLEMAYSDNKVTGPIYKLQFRNLHLQPFSYPRSRSKDGFTDNIDDCVAFFSAGVWMALLTLFIFVAIILSGVVMLSNMTTVNRFDDPKSKQLVIVPKD